MLLIYFIVIPILAGVFIYAIPKVPLRSLICIIETALFAHFLFVFGDIAHNGVIHNILGADNGILGIVLIADRLSIALVGVAILLFFLSFLYTMCESFFDKKFAMLFFILQGLLCGIFLTDDLFNIYVLLEVATIVVAILIMYKRDSRSMYDGMVYLLSQVVCMVFYLFGIGYMYKIFGVLSIEKIRTMIPQADPQSLVLPFAFIMTALCLKSAFFPLFSWLPHAHGTPSAPSSVSAILSGLYVKNGIYLFYVFANLFYPAIDYTQFFTVIAALSAILGFVLALAQRDIKLILAYHTVSQLGLIALGLCVDNVISHYGALYHIINHALFKSLLFLCAGMIIKQYKTRNIREIHGVMKTMPLTGIATLLGVLGITGAPLFNGSISKYFMQYGAKGTEIDVLITIINIGTILSFTKYSQMLWGKAETPKKQHTPKYIVTLFLGALCILGGVCGVAVMNIIFDTSLAIDSGLYLEKTVIYIVTVIGAYFAYKLIISRSAWLYKISKVTLNFQHMILCMILFFISVVVTMSLQFVA